MKLRRLAVVALAIGITLFVLRPGGAQAAPPGPFDHDYVTTIDCSSNGCHPNATIDLKLGKNVAETNNPIGVSFFHDATTTYTGLAPAPGCFDTPSVGSCGANPLTDCPALAEQPPPAITVPCVLVGDNVGDITFDIQTNVDAGFSLANHNINPVTGQIPRCQTPDPPYLHVTSLPFQLYAASIATAGNTANGKVAGTVSAAAIGSPAPAGTPPDFAAVRASAWDQGPDEGWGEGSPPLPAAAQLSDGTFDPGDGAAPLGVTHLPAWYGPLVKLVGIETAVISRSMGIATVINSKVSVNFLVINPSNGSFVTVTVLADPSAAFDPANQGQVTCPPFASTVHTKGTGAGKAWDCSKDYFGNLLAGTCPGGGSGNLSPAAGTFLSTVTGANGGTYSYKIALSTSPLVANVNCASGAGNPNYDPAPGGPGIATCSGGNTGPIYNAWNNCPSFAGPDQADANLNGIGNVCKDVTGPASLYNVAVGGIPLSAENANTSAVANAHLTCMSFDATPHSGLAGPQVIEFTPPFAACQDADQDGVLNTVDNCPLTPNGPLNRDPGGVFGSARTDQQDTDRDGLGDACDPQPLVPGAGEGYVAGSVPGVTSVGDYKIYDDVCSVTLTIAAGGPVPTGGAATCTPWPVDSNNDGLPDFAKVAVGAATACLQDHASDANGNGYSDSDESTAPGAPAAAPPCSPTTPPPGFFVPFPAAGGLATDALAVGAVSSGGVPAKGCYSDPPLARGDVNLDGSVNALDLNLIGKSFLAIWTQNIDPVSEKDLNRDHLVNALDLNIAGKRFLLDVSANCGGGGLGGVLCSNGGATIAVLPGAAPSPTGCASITKTPGGDPFDPTITDVTVAFDRLPVCSSMPAPGPANCAALESAAGLNGQACDADLSDGEVGGPDDMNYVSMDFGATALKFCFDGISGKILLAIPAGRGISTIGINGKTIGTVTT